MTINCHRLVIQIALLFAVACVCLTANANDDWVDLLPSGDLSKHWETKGNWSVNDDGVISLVPRPGEKGWSRFDAYLWLKQDYTDFQIDFEFKLDKGGNSGFYFRVADKKSPVAKGIEVQIYESHSKGKERKLTDHDCGGIIPRVPPTKNAAKPAGEWNRFVITSRGDKLTVELNGQVVNEVDLTKMPLNSRPRNGAIGFQDHALPLWLRNIRIRPL